MSIRKTKDWRDVFMEPICIGDDIENCTLSQYNQRLCYPAVFDSVPVEERQGMGYFFADEVTPENADRVRFLRCRSFYTQKDPFDDECQEAFSVPFDMSSVNLPNVETIVGDVECEKCRITDGYGSLREILGEISVREADVVLPFLQKVGSEDLVDCGGLSVTVGGSLSCPSLENVHGKILTWGHLSLDSLERAYSISVHGGSGDFPALKDCVFLEAYGDLQVPSLERVDDLNLWGDDGPYSFPRLKSVSSYVSARGVARLEVPELTYVGGLVLNGVAGSSFILPSLQVVGSTYVDRQGKAVNTGNMELGFGRMDLHSLRTVFGDCEYCHAAVADFSSLVDLKGDFYVNCGHWRTFGGDGYTRHEVTDKTPKVMSFPLLEHIGGAAEVHDNSVMDCPSLRSVGALYSGRNVQWRNAGKVDVSSSKSLDLVPDPDHRKGTVLVVREREKRLYKGLGI